MNTFSHRWTIRGRTAGPRPIWSPKHRTGSILLTARMAPQRWPLGDWRSDEKAIEPTAVAVTVAQCPPASRRFSHTSGEVGRKFRDLIQGDGGTQRDRRDVQWQDDACSLSRDAAFLLVSYVPLRHRRPLTRKGTRQHMRVGIDRLPV